MKKAKVLYKRILKTTIVSACTFAVILCYLGEVDTNSWFTTRKSIQVKANVVNPSEVIKVGEVIYHSLYSNDPPVASIKVDKLCTQQIDLNISFEIQTSQQDLQNGINLAKYLVPIQDITLNNTNKSVIVDVYAVGTDENLYAVNKISSEAVVYGSIRVRSLNGFIDEVRPMQFKGSYLKSKVINQININSKK